MSEEVDPRTPPPLPRPTTGPVGTEVEALAPEHGRVLLDVALLFGATLDLETLLPLVLARATELLHADRALFALTDARGNIQRAVLHNLEWAGPGHPLPVSQSLIKEVLTEGRPVVVADAQTNQNFQRNQSVMLFQLRFMMGVPVAAMGRTLGVIYVDSRASQVKDLQQETALLVAMSRLVGTAVENARLFADQRYRTRLLAALVHDLRAPLSVILANAELLTAMGEDAEECAEMVGDIAASAKRMRRMVDNTLELSRIDEGASPGPPTRLDVSTAIREHVRGLEVLARPLELVFDLDLPAVLPPVCTVPDRLWIILDNLLFNALRHAPGKSAIRVVATLRADVGPLEAQLRPEDEVDMFARAQPLVPLPAHPFVEVAVQNQGPPIPAHLLPYLFEAYTRSAEGLPGLRSNGLGLSIVQQCVRHLGGCVWVESSEADGTRFAFTLPTEVEQARGPAPLPAMYRRRDTMPMQSIFQAGEDDGRGSGGTG